MNDDGSIVDIVVFDINCYGDDFNGFFEFMIKYVGDLNVGLFDLEIEVEFDCDYNLKYEEMIKVMIVVMGYKKDGEMIIFVDKVRIKDNGLVEFFN